MNFWESLSDFFKKHVFGMIGFVIGFIGPIALFCFAWVTKTPSSNASSFAIPAFAWPVLFALVIFYWAKLRGFMKGKVSSMKTANEIHEGKYVFGIVACTVLQWIMTAGTFALLWWVFKSLEGLAYKTSEAFGALAIIESVAGVFFALDSAFAYGGKGKK